MKQAQRSKSYAIAAVTVAMQCQAYSLGSVQSDGAESVVFRVRLSETTVCRSCADKCAFEDTVAALVELLAAVRAPLLSRSLRNPSQ
jgi:hypothetical protein